MRYTKLGNTNVEIPVVGQGTTGAGSKAIATPESIKKRIDVLRYGIDLGMNLLDTADSYEDEHTEEIVGQIVHGIRDKVFVCTKFEPKNNSYNGIIQSIEESLKRLKTDYIDLYQVHWPNPSIPIYETMSALTRLVEQGKIRFIGVCNFSPEEISEADKCLDNDSIVSVQAELNMYNRIIEKSLIPYCVEYKKTILAYSIFNQGQFLGNEQIQFISQLAEKYGVSDHQIILNWVLSKPPIIAVLRSMSFRNTLSNAKAIEFELGPEDINRLDSLFIKEPVLIDTSEIKIIDYDVDDSHPVYTTLEGALQNPMGMKPSPADLATDVVKGKLLKPIELIPAKNSSDVKYFLLHGRIRFWAWIIAFEGKKPIPAYILDR
ncbi:MAG: aldo/keto reductase [Deltaproteobacteria bacterium]|nr:aldo/keto reductase [Deltaproteobacteria bacterium]